MLPVELVVGVRHALRPARGAGGVDESHQIAVRPRRGPGRRHRGARHRADVRLGRGVEQRYRLHRLPRERRRVVAKLGVGDQQLRAGVGQDVGDLTGRQAIVDRQQHGAPVADGERQVKESRAVLHPERHDVARTHAHARQPRGPGAGAVEHLAIADLAPLVDERRPLRRDPCVVGQKLGEVRCHGRRLRWRRRPRGGRSPHRTGQPDRGTPCGRPGRASAARRPARPASGSA